MTGRPLEVGSPAFFRAALLALAGVTTAGTAIELAMARHWQSLEQAIPWIAIGAMSIAVGLLVGNAGRRRVRAARTLAAAAFVLGCVGVWRHVAGNYDAAPLDAHYALIWDQMSSLARWWAAFIDSVGPSPTFAPMVLAQAAVCLLLSTIGSPGIEPPGE